MKKEPLENQLSRYKEEAVWPNVNEIRHKAIIDYKDIKEGMRIIDTFIFRPNESDIIDLPCIIKSVEYGDLSYSKKCHGILVKNILTQSLCPSKYDHAPGFIKYVRDSGLPFKPYEFFSKESISERAKLYKAILIHDLEDE